jgi:formate-dependent nitrite reductase membrane component NrfD
MPIVFLFSAIVSGIAIVLLIYMVSTMFRWKQVSMPCMNKLAELLFYAILVDFSLEALDFIQRLYESEESINILSQMISSRLFISLIISQVILGTLIPLVALAAARFGRIPDEMRRIMYLVAAVLVQVGIFSTRWNVVIGGQLFSKSLRGLTFYKLELFGLEGLLASGALIVLPFVILFILVKLFSPWDRQEVDVTSSKA